MLKGGVPTISFRDLTIQRRENDLVCASFGRGFYILDDISPLREVSSEGLAKEARLFPVKDALWYTPRRSGYSQGASLYAAKNPPYGATFTYYLPEGLKSMKAKRQEKEKKLTKEGKDIPFPGWEELDKEKLQAAPEIRLTIKDAEGQVVKVVKGKTSKGIHRVSWDLNRASKMGIKLGEKSPQWGVSVWPGRYTVSLSKVVDGVITELSEPQSFEVKPLQTGALKPASTETVEKFRKEFEAFQQDYMATSMELEKSQKRVKAMQAAVLSTDKESGEIETRIYEAGEKIKKLDISLNGSPSHREIIDKGDPNPGQRLYYAMNGLVTMYGPTKSHMQSLEIGKSELGKIKSELAELVDNVLPQLEKDLKDAGAPWIEGQGLIKEPIENSQ
jgi:hypothetical protein